MSAVTSPARAPLDHGRRRLPARREIVLTNFMHGSAADGDTLAALLAKGALNGVHFHTDDLDATFEKVRAWGAEIVEEPTEQPWGAGLRRT